MLLYHGSNVQISKIDLSKSKPNKDFGSGFYLSDDFEQAKEMAKMAVKLFEGEDFDQENLKEGRYYFSEYQKVDSSNIDEYLSAEEAIAHSEM